MSKSATEGGTIEVRESEYDWQTKTRTYGEWVDISDMVFGIDVRRIMDKVNEIVLHVRNRRNGEVEIEAAGPLALDDVIKLNGVDISDHVSEYTSTRRVGDVETLLITYQADPETLRYSFSDVKPEADEPWRKELAENS